MKNTTKIRIILWSALAAAVFGLLYKGIVPGGRIVYSTDFKRPDYFMGKLTPAERWRHEAGDEGSQRPLLVGDPVYFNLRAPRPFDEAILKIKYKRRGSGWDNWPVIEAGVLADKTAWRYSLEPVENRVIDQLSLVWNSVREGDLLLLQKEKKYDSIADFLEATTTPESVALYNYEWQPEFILPDYKPDRGGEDIDVPLRGPYQFYTYIKDEELDFKFTLLDMNENRDSDQAELFLYYEDALIAQERLDDDGNISDNGQKSAERELELKLANLPTGAYKIELRANNDIITGNISTKQAKLAFINKFELADKDKKFITFWTDSRKIQATTVYPDGLQTIGAGSKELTIDETYKQFEASLQRPAVSKLNAIFLDRDGLALSGDGVFALSPEAYLNPRTKKADGNLDVKADGIDYVLARYPRPETKEGWRAANATLDLRRAYREDGKYSLMLSLPGLKADDGTDDGLEISEIRIELTGKTLWEKVKEFLK